MSETASKALPPQWRSEHVFKVPEWVEPVAIVGILFGAMYITRRRNFSILRKGVYERLSSNAPSPLPRSPRSSTSSDGEALLAADLRRANREPNYPPKLRRIFNVWTVQTPNSSRFAQHWHSRVLQKFPFLIEMFYWILTYFFYRMTAVLSQVWYGGTKGLWDVAQGHGIALLELEARVFGASGTTGTERWMEWNLQQWYLQGAEAGDWRGIWLTVLNRSYALIHIPGTVGFIAYYYWAAPTHARFATVRRTMTLLNLFAFLIFIMYPCMPPRLLPREYGFVDTVNAEDAESVWMSGKYVNKLAAMPSMHFGYAFCIGCVFVVESGVLSGLRRRTSRALFGYNDVETAKATAELGGGTYGGDNEGCGTMADAEKSYRRPACARMFFFILGVWYPSWILLCIMATANHYLLDAIAAAGVVLMAYLCNRVLFVFLPLEDWLLWALRLEKPVPTTGWVKRDRGRTIR
ncbi:hypothetical protein MCOR31_007158 [Pyricularia oryzae]|nr:hypothetical protein MCOR01_000054 [Pyricularia oryzae]KAI6364986.1 hypothetical protein MCOR31_007158 [Pyricularia oryzae]KAI6414536.1 hypothetical protein MCOR24_006291 [Pyricularia oryzae]KAI6442570.1 hypothetical protein MCOR22_005841 [Pyricularia oryzae]KAI6487479.1 hypothetical protein MCOR11_008808 [Pyricularia oryzae]